MSSNGELSKKQMAGIGCLMMLVIIAISWIATGNEFFLYKFFAPKTEAVRRQTFEQSKAYNQGMAQELSRMKYDWITADAEHKAALAAYARQTSADYPLDKLPPDLRTWVLQIRSGN